MTVSYERLKAKCRLSIHLSKLSKLLSYLLRNIIVSNTLWITIFKDYMASLVKIINKSIWQLDTGGSTTDSEVIGHFSNKQTIENIPTFYRKS